MGKRKGKEWKNSCYVVGFPRRKRMFSIRETYVSPCGNVRFPQEKRKNCQGVCGILHVRLVIEVIFASYFLFFGRIVLSEWIVMSYFCTS